MIFTDRTIQSLNPRKERFFAWEDGKTGFGVRVSPKGKKSFVFMYRFDGIARRMTIGSYPRIGLADARVKFGESKAKLTKGIDPGKEWVEEKSGERGAPTVSKMADEYLDKWARPRKKSAFEDERILKRDVLPIWGRRKAKDITRRDVITLLDEIVDRGAPIAANRTLAVIRKMFNFAMGRDIIDATPCAAISAPSPENRKDRVLSEEEIKIFWLGLDRARMSEGSRLALKLQLVTAQRKGEILSAEWSELDLLSRMWTIPGGKSKNKLPHRVPLSRQAIGLLYIVRSLTGDSRWLFPSPGKKEAHVIPTSVGHALRNNQDIFEIPPFTPHDLRRTAASHMTKMGISRLVIGKIVNHMERGVISVYDRHSYDSEKRKALDAWSIKLGSILTDQGEKAKVIPFVKPS